MKYRQEQAGDPNPAGYDLYGSQHPDWSSWIHPLPGYKLSCCDCGLVHELQFATHVEANVTLMRVRRRNRSTAAVRREMKRRA